MQPITVAIGTRNRGDTIARTVRTVLASTHTAWTLQIVDQSDDDRTAQVLEPFLADPRIRYLRSPTVGIAVARNLAVHATTTELVAITDDDCDVAPEWLTEIERAFARGPRIGLVFGNVLPGPHDPRAGFVPAYVRSAPALARSLRDKNLIEGTGASMAVRRAMWDELGGFDEELGTGALLRAAEETDLTIRALRAGWFVYETPLALVTHHGFYPWAHHRAVMAKYWYGTGAAFARSFTAEPVAIGGVLLGLAGRWAIRSSPVASSSSLDARPHRLARLSAFARGFAAGLIATRRPGAASGHAGS